VLDTFYRHCTLVHSAASWLLRILIFFFTISKNSSKSACYTFYIANLVASWLLRICSVLLRARLRAHCNTLQRTATHCNTLQHTATHCNTYFATHLSGAIARTPACSLQHTATHCNTLQHTATHCNTLQHSATLCNTYFATHLLGAIARTPACSLQHTATRCNTLQHTATLCNTLQHVLCNTFVRCYCADARVLATLLSLAVAPTRPPGAFAVEKNKLLLRMEYLSFERQIVNLRFLSQLDVFHSQ